MRVTTCNRVCFSFFLQEFGEDCKDCKDVTKFLPDGASSIVVSKDTGTWQVFTELSFRGTSAKLEANGQYEYPSDMRLQKPVKSFRKAP